MSEPLQAGEIGAGGYHAVWDARSDDGTVAEHLGLQYAGAEHQTQTALSGMWLFLATELLFFGGLFLLYVVYREKYAAAFAEASAHSEHLIGVINTVLLLTSSAIFAFALGRARAGDNHRLFLASACTGGLGVAFLLLKAWEWKLDLGAHLFPGPGFAIGGADSGGAQIFWSFYFISTGLHGIHMIVGVGLVTWIALTARRQRYSALYFAPVEAVGLYWSFVDMVWLVLFPTIYLAGGRVW